MNANLGLGRTFENGRVAAVDVDEGCIAASLKVMGEEEGGGSRDNDDFKDSASSLPQRLGKGAGAVGGLDKDRFEPLMMKEIRRGQEGMSSKSRQGQDRDRDCQARGSV